jgi:hypothetical protein
MGMVNAGFALIADRVGSVAAGAAVTYLAWGTGTTAHSASQTALVTEVSRAAGTVSRTTTNVSNDTLQLVKAFSITGTYTIAEVGAFNASSGGTMLCRTKLSTTRDVTSGSTFTYTQQVVFS